MDRSGALLLWLRVAGVTEAGTAKLEALRQAWRDRDPALDGFDERLSFARWLYRQGRIAG